MYIRTSNHEILNVIEKKVSNFLGGFWYVCKNHNPKEIHSDFVIKEADTIKELCDCFVYFDITHQVHTVFSLEEYKKYKQDKYWTCDLHIWYAAIWTEWGLKYVAKLENGDLELI